MPGPGSSNPARPRRAGNAGRRSRSLEPYLPCNISTQRPVRTTTRKHDSFLLLVNLFQYNGLMPNSRPGKKKEQIIKLLRLGTPYNKIAGTVRCSKSTICFHARKIGIPARIYKKYDWEKIQTYHSSGNSLSRCMNRFGFSRASWAQARKAGRIKTRDWMIPLNQLLVIGRPTTRTHIKMRLLKAGLLQYRCSDCGISRWQGKPLSLELEHKNGNKYDNRLENLSLLCPNCHSQTPTYGSRNKRRYLPRSLMAKRPPLEGKIQGSSPCGAAIIDTKQTVVLIPGTPCKNCFQSH